MEEGERETQATLQRREKGHALALSQFAMESRSGVGAEPDGIQLVHPSSSSRLKAQKNDTSRNKERLCSRRGDTYLAKK